MKRRATKPQQAAAARARAHRHEQKISTTTPTTEVEAKQDEMLSYENLRNTATARVDTVQGGSANPTVSNHHSSSLHDFVDLTVEISGQEKTKSRQENKRSRKLPQYVPPLPQNDASNVFSRLMDKKGPTIWEGAEKARGSYSGNSARTKRQSRLNLARKEKKDAIRRKSESANAFRLFLDFKHKISATPLTSPHHEAMSATQATPSQSCELACTYPSSCLQRLEAPLPQAGLQYRFIPATFPTAITETPFIVYTPDSINWK